MSPWQVCLDFVLWRSRKEVELRVKAAWSFLFPGIMGSSNSSHTNKPRDSKQLQFPHCWKRREFKARTFMTWALTVSLFSHSSANHWRSLRLVIHTQDHLVCHHHRCVHCKGAGWHHCSRSRSKRRKGPVWGQSWLGNSGAHCPWAAANTQTLLWGDQEEGHRLAPDPHWKHCGEALPQRDQR